MPPILNQRPRRDNAYCRSFDSGIIEVDRERNRVALARTAFSPGGGGQPHDLGKQADGGTHAASTADVGRAAVTKTESRGKGDKSIRLEALPA